jgi:hypothetical protein
MFRDLARGHFVALGPALSRRPLPVVIGAVETSARSSSPKLMPLPEAPQDVHDLILTPAPDEYARPVRRESPPAPVSTAGILAQLTRPKLEVPPPEQPVFPIIDEAEREAGIEAVLREIIEDPDAGFRTDAVLYQDFLVRCRIRRVPGEPLALPAFRRRFAVARAGVAPDSAAGDSWDMALSLSETLPDDLQGVFLLLARAAVSGSATPSNVALARAYGTHSERRAQRLIAYFEEKGLVVLRTDFHGRRILAFPDLGCETAPADPSHEVIESRATAAE